MELVFFFHGGGMKGREGSVVIRSDASLGALSDPALASSELGKLLDCLLRVSA